MHTKGPWTTIIMDDEFPPSVNVINDADCEWVAECGHPNTPSAQANARLIAAAPDLLEALEYLVEQYPNNRGMNKTREAIRKAKSHADTLKGE